MTNCSHPTYSCVSRLVVPIIFMLAACGDSTGGPGETTADAGGDVLELTDLGTSSGEIEACPEAEEGETQLYSHQVQSATSDDGVTFTADDRVLLEHASVPDVVRRPDGERWLYFVNGVAGQHAVFVARMVEDGTFETFDCIRIDGRIEGNAVDPDVVLLDDGRYRLFYFHGWFTGGARPPEDGMHPFYSAISDDGIHFEIEELMFETADGGTDPTGVGLDDGSWLVAIAHSDRTMLFRSDDGGPFEDTGVSFDQGIPELAVMPDGMLRLYNAQRDGMRVYQSEDGAVWTDLGLTGARGADPSLVVEDDGTFTLYVKVFEPEGQGGSGG